MRIAFVGKGGSGKTTVSSSFALYLASQGVNVAAFDADINQHLGDALGVKRQLPSMGDGLDEIKEYLRGSRELSGAMHKTTPPGRDSRFVTLDASDWFMNKFSVNSNGLRVAGAGTIPEGNIGVKCFHGLNGAIELVLGHMLDRQDEYVLVDMTAGADAFSSSLFAKVDAIVLVAEPSLKSLSVYDQFVKHLDGFDIPLFVVANKVIDKDDLAFITERVGPIVASIPPSPYIKRRERGEQLGVSDMDKPLQEAMERLRNTINNNVERDWDALEQRSHRLHEMNAKSWMGEKVLSHIDPDFSLSQHAHTVLGR